VFAVFELTDSLGRKLFESIRITLVCDDCLQTEHPEKYAAYCLVELMHTSLFSMFSPNVLILPPFVLVLTHP